MVKQYKDNLFALDLQAIVNPVNTKGVMGAGLAKQFKERFPNMFRDYVADCRNGNLTIGRLHTFDENGQTIINLPTKDHWRDASQLSYVEEGLDALVVYAKENQLASLGVPPLGTGLGGLSTDDVYPVMQEKLQTIANNGTRVVFYDPEKGAIEMTKQESVPIWAQTRLQQLEALTDDQLEQFEVSTTVYLALKDTYNTSQADTDIAVDSAMSTQLLEIRRGEREAIDYDEIGWSGVTKAHSDQFNYTYYNTDFKGSNAEHLAFTQKMEREAHVRNHVKEVNPVFLEHAVNKDLPHLSRDESADMYDRWVSETPSLQAMTVRQTVKWNEVTGDDALVKEYNRDTAYQDQNEYGKQLIVHTVWLEKALHSKELWLPERERLQNLRASNNAGLKEVLDAYSTDLQEYDRQLRPSVPIEKEPIVVDPARSHHVMTTGHRPDKMVGEWAYLNAAESKQLHDDMQLFIRERAEEHGHVTVHSGMSQGADTIFAYAALSEREVNPGTVSLHCDIPFEGQDGNWAKDAREKFNYIREQADSETVYGPSYANKWYAARNRGMVDASDECTAVYNGIDESGGTRMTVDMIMDSGKDVTYFGGYSMKDKTISLEVAEQTYKPTPESIEQMDQLTVVEKMPLVEQREEKKKAAALYKKMKRKETAQASTAKNDRDSDGLGL